mmetsp:Transcript_19351/g.73118  ORF Transcript_19351/g.73118 Transcript_19351/m.73118 type:complete len:448 (+) Transcript_19351:3760-5103(+)
MLRCNREVGCLEDPKVSESAPYPLHRPLPDCGPPLQGCISLVQRQDEDLHHLRFDVVNAVVRVASVRGVETRLQLRLCGPRIQPRLKLAHIGEVRYRPVERTRETGVHLLDDQMEGDSRPSGVGASSGYASPEPPSKPRNPAVQDFIDPLTAHLPWLGESRPQYRHISTLRPDQALYPMDGRSYEVLLRRPRIIIPVISGSQQAEVHARLLHHIGCTVHSKSKGSRAPQGLHLIHFDDYVVRHAGSRKGRRRRHAIQRALPWRGLVDRFPSHLPSHRHACVAKRKNASRLPCGRLGCCPVDIPDNGVQLDIEIIVQVRSTVKLAFQAHVVALDAQVGFCADRERAGKHRAGLHGCPKVDSHVADFHRERRQPLFIAGQIDQITLQRRAGVCNSPQGDAAAFQTARLDIDFGRLNSELHGRVRGRRAAFLYECGHEVPARLLRLETGR